MKRWGSAEVKLEGAKLEEKKADEREMYEEWYRKELLARLWKMEI